jgi:hypothetical protein
VYTVFSEFAYVESTYLKVLMFSIKGSRRFPPLGQRAAVGQTSRRRKGDEAVRDVFNLRGLADLGTEFGTNGAPPLFRVLDSRSDDSCDVLLVIEIDDNDEDDDGNFYRRAFSEPQGR